MSFKSSAAAGKRVEAPVAGSPAIGVRPLWYSTGILRKLSSEAKSMAKKGDGGDTPVKLRLKLSGRSGESGSGQVARQLRELIGSGRLKPGDALPSEDALAGQLGVGRKVVRQAYGKLVDEGLLVRDFPRNKRVAAPKTRPRAKRPVPKAAFKKSARR